MPWLRLDENFAGHPKILRLPRGDRWTWLETMLYCARYRTHGLVDSTIREHVRGATPKFLNRCHEAGLLDQTGNQSGTGKGTTYIVHDWQVYNGATILARVAAFLSQNENATGNDVHRALGGKRETVLAAVATLRGEPQEASQNGGTLAGTDPGSQTGTGSVPQPVPLMRARGPQPQKPELPMVTKAEEQRPATDTTWEAREDPVVRLLRELRHPDANTETVLRSFARRLPEAAFDQTRDEIARNRETIRHDARYAVQVLKRIEDEGSFATPRASEPTAPGDEGPKRSPLERALAMVETVGFDYDPVALGHELDDLGVTDPTERRAVGERVDSRRAELGLPAWSVVSDGDENP